MKRLLGALASLKLTLPGMLALAAGVLLDYRAGLASPWWVAGPLLVLALNLSAALVSHPSFRRQPGLLAFHLALLAVLALGALEQLQRFDGRVELLVGEPFRAADVEVRGRGPLYRDAALARVSFRQGHFAVDYGPGLTRGETRSRVLLGEASQAVEFGDTRPLNVAGFRFHTTSNKGYAALLTWQGRGGGRALGAVHFPSYPLKDWRQVNRWRTPQGAELTLELALAEPVPDGRAWRLDSREAARAASLVRVRFAGHELAARRGEWLSVAGGRLRLESVGMWMGYRVSYNPLLAWLLAAGAVGAVGLAWHFWQKLWSRPLRAAAPPATPEERARDAALGHA